MNRNVVSGSKQLHNSTQDEIDSLVYRAIAISEEKRYAWLIEQCGENETLLNEVASLITAHEQSGTFLETTIDIDSLQLAKVDYSGQRLGPWKLLSLVGFGGMGHVYKACRDDGAYEQTVAVKVSAAKGLKSEFFHRERQTLARLNHPAITRIIDAGEIPNSTDSYLVMEYVDGETLDTFAAKASTSLGDIVDVITSLLDALHKVHQQGVLHCDIKPENILITEVSQPKLLDFGISRLERESETLGKFSGLTPKYASPQRLEGSSPTITDDVYSMGLVLKHTLSHRYSANLKFNEAPSRELASIINKATHPLAEQRYQSAADFSADLLRWKRKEPVSAMQGSGVYVISKWLHRHKIASSAIAICLVAIVSAFVLWQRHNQTLLLAAAQEQQVEAALQLAKELREGLDAKFTEVQGSLHARLATSEVTLQQLEKIHSQQPDNARIMRMLGESHMHLAQLYFLPTQLHIGDLPKSLSHIEEAYNLLHAAYKADPTVDSFIPLANITRRITASLIIIERDYQTSFPFEQALVEEYQQYRNTSSIGDARHRIQLIGLLRFNLLNGNYTEAKKQLDEALSITQVVDPMISDYEKRRMQKQAARLREQAGVFALTTGDLATAEKEFAWVLKTFREAKPWFDLKRALFASRALGCISLLKPTTEKHTAIEHFTTAYSLAEALANKAPNAIGLQWEIADLEDIHQLQYTLLNSENPLMSEKERQIWIKSFDCDDPAFLLMPAGPPEGWKAYTQGVELRYKSMLKPL